MCPWMFHKTTAKEPLTSERVVDTHGEPHTSMDISNILENPILSQIFCYCITIKLEIMYSSTLWCIKCVKSLNVENIFQVDWNTCTAIDWRDMVHADWDTWLYSRVYRGLINNYYYFKSLTLITLPSVCAVEHLYIFCTGTYMHTSPTLTVILQ